MQVKGAGFRARESARRMQVCLARIRSGTMCNSCTAVDGDACAVYSRDTVEHEHKHCWEDTRTYTGMRGKIGRGGQKQPVEETENGTRRGIKMDGANRMLIEPPLLFLLLFPA